MTIATIRRRIAAISALIRPYHSLEAKLERLTPEQRAAYDYWRDRMEQWHRDYRNEKPYQRLIEGDPGPSLRRDVSEALFGKRIMIPADATERDVAEIYQRMVLGE